MKILVFFAWISAVLGIEQCNAAELLPPPINPYQDLWTFRLENRFILENGDISSSTQTLYALRVLSILPVALSMNWALGPSVIAPTATPSKLGSGKWQVGPDAAITFVNSEWNIVIVLAQLWSIAEDASRPTTSVLQGFFYVFRNLPDDWQIGSTPEMLVDWHAPGGDRLALPLALGVGKTFLSQKLNVYTEAQYFVVTPKSFGPEWLFQLRISYTIPRP